MAPFQPALSEPGEGTMRRWHSLALLVAAMTAVCIYW